MKSITYLLAIVLITIFSSCSDKVEEYYNEVNADLTVDIQIAPLKSHDPSSDGDHPFSGFSEYFISDMFDQEISSDINSIKPRPGSYIMLTGIIEDYEINSLTLIWNYKSSINPNIVVEKSIDLLSLDYTLTNGVFNADIDNVLSDLISKIDDKNGTVKIELAGLSNNYLNCVAKLNIPVTVESKIYSPRFDITF